LLSAIDIPHFYAALSVVIVNKPVVVRKHFISIEWQEATNGAKVVYAE
jgi:hypothetical protein